MTTVGETKAAWADSGKHGYGFCPECGRAVPFSAGAPKSHIDRDGGLCGTPAKERGRRDG